jgi:small conductance mechanosensitive channel
MSQEDLIGKYEQLKHLLGLYGQDLAVGMLLLVIGLIALHGFIRWFRSFLVQHKGDQWPVGKITAIVYFILLEIVVNVSLVIMGLDAETIVRFVVIVSLSVVALIILLRPYFPVLPFHVGHTVKIDGLFGKVVATNLYHTQLKTFDGKTIFIPNTRILKNVVVNYHHTPGRRIKINLHIPYDEDLPKAKQIIEAIMIADPRVLTSPRPQVWTLDVEGGSVGLGARCWADNAKYWLTRCELTEKIKLRFDHEGIRMALPRHQVFLHPQTGAAAGTNGSSFSVSLREVADENQ